MPDLTVDADLRVDDGTGATTQLVVTGGSAASEAKLEAVRALLAAEDFATEAKLEAVRMLLAGTLAVSAAALPLPSGAATEDTQANRYAGGKAAVTAQVTASGDTTVHAPAAGKAIRVYWVAAMNDPDESVSPRIVVKLAGASESGEIYRAYAVAHWEVFTGDADAPLVVNLDEAGDVAVTVHYEEVAP